MAATLVVMVANFRAGLYSRLYRDHLRSGADCRPGSSRHGPRPRLAGNYDSAEPTNLIPHTAIRFCAFLPARVLRLNQLLQALSTGA